MAVILVVDDDDDIRDLVQLNLELADHSVMLAADGVHALALVADSRPDVIVLDVLMPGLDGWEVLRRLKAHSSDLANVPVVMLTALGDRDDRLRGGIEGAISYITKPFDPSEVVHIVDRLASGDAPPEAEARRRVQRESLSVLARLEAEESGAATNAEPEARVHLTRLEPVAAPAADVPSPMVAEARRNLELLTPVQRAIVETVAIADGVTDAARKLGTSRTNVYTSLQRIARKLDLPSSQELLAMLEDGSLLGSP